MRHVVVGTAGHIDHGKSALVKALTGIDPDRLKEEKLRGITIDLGFAHLDLQNVQVGFVDVPGHEKFVKNMLAGVGGIDFVLLVVAADESIMPQTREHFDICRLLGIRTGLIVISKIDLVEPELVEVVREELRDTVKGSFLEGAPVLPVSSKTGEGLEDLKSEIAKLALALPERGTDRLLRLPVDRAFSVRGFGTVVTGTLTSGEIQKDQDVELIPGGLTARVRGLQVYGTTRDHAVAGQRTAVNLQGVDLAQVQRGLVLTVPHLFKPTQLLDVHLSLLPTAPRPLKRLLKIRFHHGTAEVMARVALLGRESLAPGHSAYAQLRLDQPAFCLHGDRFIIRQFSPTLTIGGGTILHPHPAKLKSTDKSVLTVMQTLDSDSLIRKVPVLIAAHNRKAMDLRELNSLLGLQESVLRGICDALSVSEELRLIPAPAPILLFPASLDGLEKETLAEIDRYHRNSPLQKGISREELRKKIFDGLPLEVYRFCLEHLVEKRKISLQEEIVSLHGREVQLSAEAERLREMIEAAFRKSGYQPPLLADLLHSMDADPAEVRRIYFWMIKERILVKISEDLAYHRQTMEEIKQTVRATFTPGSKFGVAEFKDLFDLTRKHAIPLLEYLDREKFTRRQGNERILL